MKRLTACLFFLSLACGSASAATVLLPKDKAILEPGKVLVLGSARAGAAVAVRIEAGGKVREGSMGARQNGQFYFAVPLEEGLNRLTVAGETREVFVSGGNATSPNGFARQRMHGGDVSACESCHHPDLAVRGGGYPDVCLACHEIESQNPANRGRSADDRHFLASGRKCGKCHDPHGAKDAKLLVGPSQELCGACHGSRDSVEDIHAAFDDGGCVACHDPHFSGYPSQLAAPLTRVCGECHEEVLDEGHGGDLEECSTCHDPHAAMGSALARGDFAARCAECHDDVGGSKHEHPALDEGCESCHNPHSSKHGGMLHAEQTDLCGECHEVGEAKDGQVRHDPLDTCTECHGPHGGKNPKYLATAAPALCLGCHDDPAEEGAEVHAVVEDEGCLFCHDPHAGYALGMLGQRETELCAECHDLTPEGPHSEYMAGGGCSCCHEPHASETKHFLREESSSLLQSKKPCLTSGQ